MQFKFKPLSKSANQIFLRSEHNSQRYSYKCVFYKLDLIHYTYIHMHYRQYLSTEPSLVIFANVEIRSIFSSLSLRVSCNYCNQHGRMIIRCRKHTSMSWLVSQQCIYIIISCIKLSRFHSDHHDFDSHDLTWSDLQECLYLMIQI